jgi:protein involved in polysaccharide export with SLBB domain
MLDRLLVALFFVVTVAVSGGGAVGQSAPRAEPVAPINPGVGVGALERTSTIIDPDRKLQPGDQVSIMIEEDNEPEPVLKAVSAAGQLDISPLGSVKVAGLTAPQASAAIKRFLEGDYYFKATVRLSVERVNVAASMGTIYLSGEVNGVGPQPIYAGRQLTLSQAVLNAGGFRKFADSRKVKVTRNEAGAPQTYTVDVKQVIERGRTDQDMELRDGDRVFVPTAFFKH